MLTHTNMYSTIQCDKCGKRSTHLEPESNKLWYTEGWTMNRDAKKYIHLCFDCLSAKQKKSNLFVRNKFPA